ncbi:unnamed protein product [Diabrotica balteata]|uniref:Tetratricopeptide repeat protein 8 n=1 Tax=Diabrotica balteata TaxID=107213 RepID=A0A9N9T3R3_DIABA|nr:unnamed protein product [Diabrotica balteata]
MYLALSLFRRRRYDKCIDVCSSILDKQPLDQAAWCLKMRALTQRVYVDDLESEDFPEEDFLDDSVLATAPRPGTSMKTAIVPSTSALNSRPRTSTGRPISGVARPGTQMRPESALDRARTARTARPVTNQSARSIRLGTAAMLSQADDQPLSATDIGKSGLEIFPNDVSLMTELGRLAENLNDTSASVKYYRNVLIEDAINTEAVASVGMYHFYNNQPELALRYYRRALAMGAHSSELYNNLGLCCLYSQQLDFTLPYFQRAVDLATDPQAAGDVQLAVQCLNLCLSSNSTHAPAFNNLAVLYHKMGKINLAKAYLTSAKTLEPDLMEVQVNLEFLQQA